ncbi:MAG TPA: hypothetical protein VK905_03760 [Bacillota bacterium]|nr:hypothetical protein [Bacillota bacterium]
MSNERMQILQMVQEGKVTAEEAERLLGALDNRTTSTENKGRQARWLKVRVVEEGQQKVNINLPMSLVEVALGMGMKFVPEDQTKGIDVAALLEAIKQGAMGKIVEIDDEGTKVEIIVE